MPHCTGSQILPARMTRVNPLMNKKPFHSNAQSVTHGPTFAPANQKGNNSLTCFPCCLCFCFVPTLNQALLEMKNAFTRMHLWVDVLWHPTVETCYAVSTKTKLQTVKHIENSFCTCGLFSICFKKKLVVELHDHEIKRSRHPPSAEPYKLISLVLPAYLNGVTQNVTN